MASLDVNDEPGPVSPALGPTKLDKLHMLLEGREERLSLAAERNSAELDKPLLLEALAVEVFVLGHENATSLHSGHRDYGIRRVRWNIEALPVHAMATPLKVPTEGIWYVVVKEQWQPDH